MQRVVKLALTTLAATLALGITIGTASANVFAVDDQDFEIFFENLGYVTSLGSVVCDVSLLGSFHSLTIDKDAGSLIGHITHMSVDDPNCSAAPGDGVTVLNGTLPWHLTFESWGSVLPEITSITVSVIGLSLALDRGETTCLARTTLAEPMVWIAEVDPVTGQADTLTVDEDFVIDTNDTTGAACDIFGVNVGFGGTGTIEDLEGNLLFIDLAEAPPIEDPAELQATPSIIAVTDLEQNDTFPVRNTDGDATAQNIRVSVVAADREAPEFSVRSPTCSETLGPGESCTYTVVVNSRPEREGRVRLDYTDGTRDEEARSTTVEVDIES
jgi:hypothetical protein